MHDPDALAHDHLVRRVPLYLRLVFAYHLLRLALKVPARRRSFLRGAWASLTGEAFEPVIRPAEPTEGLKRALALTRKNHERR